MSVDINIRNLSERKNLQISKIKSSVKKLLEDENEKKGELNIFIIDNDEIQRINKEYLGHDYPTDVLSFSYGEKYIDGEIYIGAGVLAEQAKEYNVSMVNELKRLIIHGLLHILGYDDSSLEMKKIMTNLENKYIKY